MIVLFPKKSLHRLLMFCMLRLYICIIGWVAAFYERNIYIVFTYTLTSLKKHKQVCCFTCYCKWGLHCLIRYGNKRKARESSKWETLLNKEWHILFISVFQHFNHECQRYCFMWPSTPMLLSIRFRSPFQWCSSCTARTQLYDDVVTKFRKHHFSVWDVLVYVRRWREMS